MSVPNGQQLDAFCVIRKLSENMGDQVKSDRLDMTS